MKIIIITNAMTPHQAPLCDALMNCDGCDLTFIETKNVDKEKLPIGWRFLEYRDYVVSYQKYKDNREHYQKEILKADAVIFGSVPFEFIKERIKANKLVFFYAERFYRTWKDKIKWPYHLIKFNYLYHRRCVKLLCASAFTMTDFKRIGCFIKRGYKWGYFTNVDKRLDIGELLKNTSNSEITTLMWCGRFLTWKHPELAIYLAKELKDRGYQFHLDMYGIGEMFEFSQKLVEELCVSDVITFKGTVSNKQIHEAMRQHQIFLFTSDQCEGWGAVANEAMSNGCVVVGSDAIGSTPYLIEDGKNGILFRSAKTTTGIIGKQVIIDKNALNSLVDKVTFILDNPNKREELARSSYQTMCNIWSPERAAISFIELTETLLSGEKKRATQGPCSIA